MHFAIMLYDEPDSAALRDQYRPTHLDYLKVCDDQTRFAGLSKLGHTILAPGRQGADARAGGLGVVYTNLLWADVDVHGQSEG